MHPQGDRADQEGVRGRWTRRHHQLRRRQGPRCGARGRHAIRAERGEGAAGAHSRPRRRGAVHQRAHGRGERCLYLIGVARLHRGARGRSHHAFPLQSDDGLRRYQRHRRVSGAAPCGRHGRRPGHLLRSRHVPAHGVHGGGDAFPQHEGGPGTRPPVLRSADDLRGAGQAGSRLRRGRSRAWRPWWRRTSS